jgi:rhodanese-related sulfurtransferase
MNEISIYQIINQPNINLIDIRDNYSYQQGHLPQAKNIPYLVLKLLLI